MKRDRRQRVIETALTSPHLTYGQKVFMVLAATLKPEYVDGKRRHGSKAMGPDGTFSLHLDYIAKALGTSVDNAKKLREGCARHGHLSLVHKGTFGRPSAWQALVVRGEEMYGVTFRQILPPYGSGTPVISGEGISPLTYRGGTDPARQGLPRPSLEERRIYGAPGQFPGIDEPAVNQVGNECSNKKDRRTA